MGVVEGGHWKGEWGGGGSDFRRCRYLWIAICVFWGHIVLHGTGAVTSSGSLATV